MCSWDSDHPRGIPNCEYNTGDTLIVSYTQGTEAIAAHKVKCFAS